MQANAAVDPLNLACVMQADDEIVSAQQDLEQPMQRRGVRPPGRRLHAPIPRRASMSNLQDHLTAGMLQISCAVNTILDV